MASGITLSAGVRQNLLSLQNTAQMMATTQNRLATGKKVNSALDNPSNFFTSSSLQSRGNDLSSLLDSMANGVKTLEAADNGLTSITKTVETMQSTLRQARQDKSFQTASYAIGTLDVSKTNKLTLSGGAVGATGVDIDLNTLEVGGSKTSATTSANYAAPAAAAKSTLTGTVDMSTGTFAAASGITIGYGGKTLDVSLAMGSNKAAAAAAINTAIAGDSNFAGKITASVDASNHLKFETVGNENNAITVVDKDVGGAAAVMGASPASVAGSTGKTQFSVNGTNITLTSADSDITKAVATINSQLGANSKVMASDNGGKLAISSVASGPNSGDTAVTIAGADASLFGSTVAGTAPTTAGKAKTVDELVTEINGNTSLAGKIVASNDNGKLRIQNISTEEMTLAGATSAGTIDGSTSTTSIGGNETRKSLVKQFNELRDQLNKTADDASYNGVNLLRADKLKLTFNETGTSTMDIQVKDKNDKAMSIDADSLKIDTAVNADFNSDDKLDANLSTLGNALGSLRSQSSSLGSKLSIVQNRQDFTKSMINTLQTGADGLVLADTNQEAANLLALQTRQQLSSTALSMAAQADQAVLRLF